MERYAVTIVSLCTGAEAPLFIGTDEDGASETITFRAAVAGREFSCSHWDLFSAYQGLRDQLLALGYGIKCNGSRINAGQSGMMAGQPLVYLVEPGRRASRQDIADLFGSADIDDFPDSARQAAFWEEWLRSISDACPPV